jgi:hypothetical protein
MSANGRSCVEMTLMLRDYRIHTLMRRSFFGDENVGAFVLFVGGEVCVLHPGGSRPGSIQGLVLRHGGWPLFPWILRNGSIDGSIQIVNSFPEAIFLR